jgi:hypothetical protein
MTVAEYEQINPDWRKQMEEEERQERLKIYEELESASPFRSVRLTEEHDRVGRVHTERGEAVCIAAGMSCLEVARALRLHPGWVEHGRINEAIARDIVAAKRQNSSVEKGERRQSESLPGLLSTFSNQLSSAERS